MVISYCHYTVSQIKKIIYMELSKDNPASFKSCGGFSFGPKCRSKVKLVIFDDVIKSSTIFFCIRSNVDL